MTSFLETYNEFSEVYGGDALELVSTGRINDIPYSNSILEAKGYANTVDTRFQYKPRMATLQFPEDLQTDSGMHLVDQESLATVLFGLSQELVPKTDQQAADLVSVASAFTRATFQRSLRGAKLGEAARARHSLSEGRYHAEAGGLALGVGIGISALVRLLCEREDIPMAAGVSFEKVGDETPSANESILILYYPLISAPTLALSGLQQALEQLSEKN